jgi:Flp pilus assembly protein TadG
MPVLESPQPSYNPITQAVQQNTPEQTQGQWYQVWVVVDLNAEQIAYNEQQKAQQNKTQATTILTNTDWTSIADVADPLKSNPYLMNQADFVAYRSTVRAIAVNPTFDAVFPEAPTEQWSS